MKLNYWSVTGKATLYTPPELVRVRLQGIVDKHPKIGINVQVVTSPIKSCKGRIIETTSGSIYILGTINPSYRKYLKKIKPQWNWRKPITMKGDIKC